MIKRFVIAIIVLGLVAGGVVGFNLFRDQAIEDFFANRPVQALPVDTVVTETGTWEPALDAIGTVYARRGIELAVETGGLVREVNFEANDTVSHGDVLVRLDAEIEEADLAAAQATVTLAEQTLARVSSLGDRGVTTASRQEEAQAEVDSGRAQIQRIRAQIEQKALEAPFDGEIGIPEVEVGQFVTAGTPVATLQDVDNLRVDFTLPEQQLGQIEIGQPVEVSAQSGASAEGTITGIEPRVDPQSRLVSVRAELGTPQGNLSPGQFVTVRIVLPTQENVLALPQTAVVTSLYGDYVYTVEEVEDAGEDAPQFVANQVFVEMGLRRDDRVEIAEGLEPGTRVVIAGQNRLSNGAPVDPEAEMAAPGAATPAAEDGDESSGEQAQNREGGGGAQAAETTQ